ncbi:MAG: hypothetical protein WCG85_08355 [Polyangia bacterium]
MASARVQRMVARLVQAGQEAPVQAGLADRLVRVEPAPVAPVGLLLVQVDREVPAWVVLVVG